MRLLHVSGARCWVLDFRRYKINYAFIPRKAAIRSSIGGWVTPVEEQSSLRGETHFNSTLYFYTS